MPAKYEKVVIKVELQRNIDKDSVFFNKKYYFILLSVLIPSGFPSQGSHLLVFLINIHVFKSIIQELTSYWGGGAEFGMV